jgi:hypothetical protein
VYGAPSEEKSKHPPSQSEDGAPKIVYGITPRPPAADDLHRRILELEAQMNNSLRVKRELENKFEELIPRKMFTAKLNSDKPPYWIEAQAEIT